MTRLRTHNRRRKSKALRVAHMTKWPLPPSRRGWPLFPADDISLIDVMVQQRLIAAARDASEAALRGSLYGQMPAMTNTDAAPADALTVDKMLAMMSALPAPETWVVSTLWPSGHATRVPTPRETFILINTADWQAIETRMAPPRPADLNLIMPYLAVRPVFIDPGDSDTAERAGYRSTERRRILMALANRFSFHPLEPLVDDRPPAAFPAYQDAMLRQIRDAWG